MKPDHEKAAYGFIAWAASWVAFCVFLVWGAGLVPREYYFPDPYWSLGGPAVLTVVLTSYLLTVPLMGLSQQQPLDSAKAATDVHARPYPGNAHTTPLPPLGDLPIAEVNRMMRRGPVRDMSSARAPCVIVILLAFGSLCGAVTPSPPPTVNATEVPATSQPQDAAASGSGSGSGDYKVKPVWMVVFGLAVGITAIAAVQWIRRREHATKQRISEGMKAALNNEHTRQQNGGQDLLVAKSFSAVSPTASSEAALTPLRPKDSPILLPRQPRSTSDSGAAGLSPASPGVESGVLSPLGDPNSGANRSQPLVPGSPASTASNEATSLSSSFDSKRASSGGRLSKRLKTHLDAEHILSRVNSNNSQLTSPHLSPKSECSATPSSTRRRRLVGKRLPTLVKQDVDANYTVRSREEVLRIITELDGTEPSPPGSGEQSPEDALRLRSQQSATSASSLHPSNHPSSTAQRMRELN